ncbi:MAG TPA: glycosyltransferase family 4 protein [Chloroflexota bacterium]|nr:glycosyltransferase family 4 protein [Chloroflexota bacterium]HUM67646.1 glycosyltransferase family 4 protein [Chloroflexota bacterium]
MKILSANKFYYVFGGSDRYFFELNKLHQQAGHEIVPFAMAHPKNLPSPYESFFVSEVNYWDNPSLGQKMRAAGRVLYSREARQKIGQLLQQTQPDIAHVHLIYHQISPSILLALKDFGLPIIQTLHDYKPICPTYSFVASGRICERCLGGKFYQAALQKCNHDSLMSSTLSAIEMYLHHSLGWYDLPDMYITPSNFMRQKMMEFGLPGEKLIHIANFVDASQYAFSPTHSGYFVYLGRLTSIKGVHTLLIAMSKLKSRHARLLIIGDGPQRAELEALKVQLGLHNVEFCGYQTADALSQLLAQALFNILPSECYENCPMSVLEMMAFGKPTIGADIGGIPELIQHDETGFLFESGNAEDLAQKIDQMLSSYSKIQIMGEQARQLAEEKYSPQTHYQQILSVYHQFLS